MRAAPLPYLIDDLQCSWGLYEAHDTPAPFSMPGNATMRQKSFIPQAAKSVHRCCRGGQGGASERRGSGGTPLLKRRKGAHQCAPLLWSQEQPLPVAMSAMEVPTMVTATMEMSTTTEGEADGWSISVVRGIWLVVVGWRGVVAIPPQPSATMPVATMLPAAPTSAIVNWFNVGALWCFQPSQISYRRC